MAFQFPWQSWSIASLEPPWGPLESAYERIKADPHATLPDELPSNSNTLRFAGGALDGMRGGRGDDAEASRRIDDLIRSVLKRADDERLGRLYSALVEEHLLGCIDDLLERLVEVPCDLQRLRELALYLCTRAPEREPVKAGLALLGISGSPQDAQVAVTLGRHDEFTLFAALAAAQISADPEAVLWQMAKDVDGWGRVQIVRRLAATERPEIQQWLLREGFRNAIMEEYLAVICARAGHLHEALHAEPVDPILLNSAASMFRAMIAGGPAEDIDDYEHAPEAAERYVNLLLASSDGCGLEHFLALVALKRYLVERPGAK